MKLEIKIRPIGKPRMTQSDKWRKRDCVVEYWCFKDYLIREANKQNFLLSNKIHIEFYFKPNVSISLKKQQSLIGKPHQVKPDLDNCIKAILDSLNKKDQEIYEISASKYYEVENKIIIKNI